MRYLKHLDLPATTLSCAEEKYLDDELRYEYWCKHNKKNHGRNIHITEAIQIFKEDIHSIALSLAKSGNNTLLELLKNKTQLDYNEKIKKAKSFPIDSLLVMFGAEGHKGKYCCPIHGEKTASLKVYEETNTWYCFGCHAGRDSIDLVMAINKCDFNSAIKFFNNL